MENASKALIIAGSFLIGMVVLSIAVVLFSSFGNTGSQIMDKIEEAQLTQWNNILLKYHGNVASTIEKEEFGEIHKIEIIHPIVITAHDIISIASFAQETNKKNEFDVVELSPNKPNYDGWNEASLYLQIDLVDERGNAIAGCTNIEKRIGKTTSDGTLFEEQFLKNNSQIMAENSAGNRIQLQKCYKIYKAPEFGEIGRAHV